MVTKIVDCAEYILKDTEIKNYVIVNPNTILRLNKNFHPINGIINISTQDNASFYVKIERGVKIEFGKRIPKYIIEKYEFNYLMLLYIGNNNYISVSTSIYEND